MSEKLQNGLAQEQRAAFNRMMFWGGGSVLSTALLCANPVFVAAAIPCWYKFAQSVRRNQVLESLLNVKTSQTSLRIDAIKAGSIDGISIH